MTNQTRIANLAAEARWQKQTDLTSSRRYHAFHNAAFVAGWNAALRMQEVEVEHGTFFEGAITAKLPSPTIMCKCGETFTADTREAALTKYETHVEQVLSGAAAS